MKKNMKYWRRYLSISAAILPLTLMSAAASADVISVGFGTGGTYQLIGSCGAGCATVGLTGTTTLKGNALDSLFGPSGAPDFMFTALVNVAPDGLGVAVTGMPPNGWQLQDAAGDGLYGSLGGFLVGGLSVGLGQINFVVTGGTGLFDNVLSGSGSSFAGYDQNGWSDWGGLSLKTTPGSSTVPEPGTLFLFSIALAALGCWSAGKRRRALTADNL